MKNAIFSIFLLLVFGSLAYAELNIELLGILEGENDGDRFGHCVASLGDINGDGFEDFGVGAPYYPEWTDTGRVYIYLGSEDFDPNPDLILENPGGVRWFGWSLCGLRDLNEDGYDEFLISAWGYWDGRVFLYLGGDPPDHVADRVYGEPIYGYGTNLASGDVNRDEIDDIVVGSGGDDSLYVYLGSAEMDTVWDYILYGRQLGMDGLATGDVNGDGYDDVVASTSLDETYLFFGRDSLFSEPDVIFPWGGQKHGVGDINGDGYDDVIYHYRVYFGGEVVDTLYDVWLSRARVTIAVGRLNADRYGDVLCENHSFGGTNTVNIYLGGVEVDSLVDWWAVGEPYGALGYSLATLDMNSDGVDEFLASEPFYHNGSRRGRVFVYTGDTTATAVPDWSSGPMPGVIHLYESYPNPFNDRTLIRFSIDCFSPVETLLSIYNVKGQLIKTLFHAFSHRAEYQVIWDGTNDGDQKVASGVYFITLKSVEVLQTRKAILTR